MDKLLNDALETHEAGDIKSAIDKYEAYLAHSPDSAEGYRLLGLAQYQEKDFLQAASSLSRALTLNQQDGRIYSSLGIVMRAQGNLDLAEKHFLKAIELDPQRPDSHNNLGIVYHQNQDFKKAEKSFKKALELKPQSCPILVNLGHLYRDHQFFDLAIEAYRQTVGLEPDNPRHLINLAHVYMENSQLDLAIKTYEKALKVDPENATVLHMINALKGTQTAHPPQEYVQELFDYYADNFDASLNALGYDAPERIAKMLENFPQIDLKNKTVIDLGCGTGACALKLKHTGAKFYGVDLSPRMVSIALQSGIYEEVIIADAITALSALSEAVDMIIGADFLIYVGACEELFKLAEHKLKKGGLFMLTAEEDPNETHGYKLQHSGRFSHTPAYMAHLAEQFGFKIIAADQFPLRKQGKQMLPGKLYLYQRL